MDSNQSQVLLMSSERFGILLAENLEEVGTPQIVVEAENIGMLIHVSLICKILATHNVFLEYILNFLSTSAAYRITGWIYSMFLSWQLLEQSWQALSMYKTSYSLTLHRPIHHLLWGYQQGLSLKDPWLQVIHLIIKISDVYCMSFAGIDPVPIVNAQYENLENILPVNFMGYGWLPGLQLIILVSLVHPLHNQ